MEYYDGDDLIKSANYEPPAGLELSAQRPFIYAEFETPVDRETQFHMHYAIELGGVTEGTMERFFADDRRRLSKGSVWMTSLLEPHWWRILEPGTRIAVFHILPEFLNDINNLLPVFLLCMYPSYSQTVLSGSRCVPQYNIGYTGLAL